MADCNSPAAISNFVSKDTLRLTGTIAKALAENSPFINVLSGGTFASGVSDEVRSVVEMPAWPGDSLVNPEFVNDTEVCGTKGTEMQTSTVEFTYRLQTKRGTGPRVCVKKGYAAFEGSYLMAEDALKKTVTQFLNVDIRYQLLDKSASKFVAAPGQPFSTLFTGGTEEDIGVGFVDIEPTGPMSFAALHKIVRYAREDLLATPFGGKGPGGYAKVILGSDQLELFRNEVGVKEVLLASLTGGFKLGESVLTGYQWEEFAQYRGIAFGVDQRPIRATSIASDGTLNFVQPYIQVADGPNNKSYRKLNPAWLAAPLEVGFVIFEGTFQRQVPERYIGEGSFKFSPQLHMGELEWHYEKDNDCNIWGDYGFHKFQITRAYRPMRPQHVIPFVFKRCEADLGLAACEVA